jgi:hypothetical protein
MRGRAGALLGAAAAALGVGAGCALAGSSRSDALVEAGRRIYQEGVLPDGTPLRAMRPEGFALEGEHAACATCHRRSGMGSVEGSVDRTILVPPVAGPVLFEPARFHDTYLDPYHHWVPSESWGRALTRGAYDDETLARALREGLDPDGKRLVAPMPRYELDAAGVAALAVYLRSLTIRPAPGVEAATLHLATIVTPDAPPEDASAVLGVLRAWSAAVRPSGQAWRLHVWELTGEPDTWQSQLEARYREEPVFAVLSGAGGAEWTPIHRFCEAERLPCVLPSTEVAPEDPEGFYSVYFSPGVVLEARILSRSLSAVQGAGAPARIVQIVSDATGRRAAETLGREASSTGPPTVARQHRPTAPGSALADLSADDALILWLRPAALEQLAAAAPEGPPAGRVFLSAFLAPPDSLSLPRPWKVRATWVTLFDDLGLQGEIAKLRLRGWLEARKIPPGGGMRAAGDAYAASHLFADSLAEIREQEVRRPRVPLSREHLLEVLETEVDKYSDGTQLVDPDAHVAFYGRMSLGPGQRTAVRGGSLVRYASPDSNELVAVGSRIVPPSRIPAPR